MVSFVVFGERFPVLPTILMNCPDSNDRNKY